jgi:chemotaxis protein CheX
LLAGYFPLAPYIPFVKYDECAEAGASNVSGLKIELISPFVEGTKEVFETMVGMKVRRKNLYLKQGYMMYGDISAIIGLSGTTMGTCAVSLPYKLALDSIERLIGESLNNDVNRVELRDGVGELINMISGRAKAILSTTQYRFDITLPTIISGEQHEFFQRKGTHCVVILFETETGQTFTLDVAVATR